MPGNIKQLYNSPNTLAVAALHSLASSSTLTAGWTSAWISNITDLALDHLVGGEIVAGTSPTAGEVRVYAYASYDDGTTAPGIFSAGTPGTEGALTVADTEQLDASMVPLWSSAVDTTTNDVYSMPPRSIAQAFGRVPQKFAIFVTHNTVAALKSSGNKFFDQPILDQYT
jgi:hypothetical protein